MPPASSELGLLKWGVGKVIAHAPRTPRVVPFFHTGMQNLVAEDPATKDVLPVSCGRVGLGWVGWVGGGLVWLVDWRVSWAGMVALRWLVGLLVD